MNKKTDNKLGVGLFNSDDPPSIICPKCNYKSYHLKDIEFEFCAHCDEFHDGCKRGYGGVKIPKTDES